MINYSFEKQYKKNIFIFSFLPILLILVAFFIDSPKKIFYGLKKIILAPDILLVDYLAIGGVGATFLNMGLLGLMCITIVYYLKIQLNGPLIAAILTIIGFAFMGKNIVNVFPVFLGGFLYAKYKNLEIKDIIVAVFFITTISPIITYLALGLGINYFISIPLALIAGIGIGFTICPIANCFIKFHNGYNLYNIGFTGGIIGTFVAALIRGFGFIIEPQSILSTEYNIFIRNSLIIISLFYIVLGFILNNKSFKGYKSLFKFSGRFLTNLIDDLGFGIAYINMGIMGLVSIIYVIIAKGIFNGPVAAGVITVMAFSAFGNNPKNSIPIMIGVYIGATLKIFDPTATPMIIAALFGTTLAPITGTFGTIAGIIAGFLHVSIASNLVTVHGGMNLYNNGFSGGIVAGIMSPILESFFQRKDIFH